MPWWTPLRATVGRVREYVDARSPAVSAAAGEPRVQQETGAVGVEADVEPAWPTMPAVQRTLSAPLSPVAPLATFASGLASFRNPSLLAPLGHRVDPVGPGGLAQDLARPVVARTFADTSELAVPPRSPAPVARTAVQRAWASWPDAATIDVVATERPDRPGADDRPKTPQGEVPRTDDGAAESASPPRAATTVETAAVSTRTGLVVAREVIEAEPRPAYGAGRPDLSDPLMSPGVSDDRLDPADLDAASPVQRVADHGPAPELDLVLPEPTPTPVLSVPEPRSAAQVAVPTLGRSVADQTSVDRATPDGSTPDRSTMERATPERVTPERVTPERVTVERTTAQTSAAEPPSEQPTADRSPVVVRHPTSATPVSIPGPPVTNTDFTVARTPTSEQNPRSVLPPVRTPTRSLAVVADGRPRAFAMPDLPGLELPVVQSTSGLVPVTQRPAPGSVGSAPSPVATTDHGTAPVGTPEPDAPLSGFASAIASLGDDGPIENSAPADVRPAVALSATDLFAIPVQRHGAVPNDVVEHPAALPRTTADEAPFSDGLTISPYTAQPVSPPRPPDVGLLGTRPASLTAAPPAAAVHLGTSVQRVHFVAPQPPRTGSGVHRPTAAQVPGRSEAAPVVAASPESFRPESFRPESFRPESFRPESFRPESLRPESLRPESAPSLPVSELAPPGATDLHRVEMVSRLGDDGSEPGTVAPGGWSTTPIARSVSTDAVPTATRTDRSPAVGPGQPDVARTAEVQRSVARSGLPAGPARGSAPAATVAGPVSFAAMFGPATFGPVTGFPGADGYTSVELQRDASDQFGGSDPAPTPAPAPQPEPPPAEPAAVPTSPTPGATPPAAAGPTDVDELVRRLYEPLSARLRAELWLDRERAGLMTDVRF